MSKLKISGFDELEKRFQALERGLRGEAEAKMLRAGAAVLVTSWKDTIEAKGHMVSHAMRDSVSMTDIRYTDNGAYIAVYPQGTDGHRVTNAQKAYILHHGRRPTQRNTKEIKGDKFVTEAENAAKAEIYEAMQNALNEYISGKE